MSQRPVVIAISPTHKPGRQLLGCFCVSGKQHSVYFSFRWRYNSSRKHPGTSTPCYRASSRSCDEEYSGICLHKSTSGPLDNEECQAQILLDARTHRFFPDLGPLSRFTYGELKSLSSLSALSCSCSRASSVSALRFINCDKQKNKSAIAHR